MNLEEQLVDSSRVIAEMVCEFLLKNPDQISNAMELAMADKGKKSNRAMRVIAFCAQKQPELIKPFTNTLAKKLYSTKNQSLTGGILYIFSLNILPEDETELGKITDYCFNVMIQEKVTASIRVFSMETLYAITNLEPELKQELLLAIEDTLPNGSAAYQVRGTKMISILKKELGL